MSNLEDVQTLFHKKHKSVVKQNYEMENEI